MNYKEEKLLPCPYCGGQIKDVGYDRRAVYECKSCGFRRDFPGLLTTEKNDCPIPYKRTVPINKFEELKKRYLPKKMLKIFPVKTKDEPVPPEEVKHQEYYHYENWDKSIEEMNNIIKEKMEELKAGYASPQSV